MHFLLESLLLISIIIVASKAAGVLSNKIGQPAVFGELLVGLLLGPSLLGLMGFFPSPEVAHAGEEFLELLIKDLAKIGVIFLMFLAGLETELDEMKRVGVAAFNGALGGVFLPFFFGFGLSMTFGIEFWHSMFIGTILTATSVSISAQTLMELGQLRSKEGTTILGAAVIDDVMGIIILSLVVALSTQAGGDAGGSMLAGIGIIVLKMVLFFAIAILLGAFLFERIASWLENIPGSEILLAFGIVIALVFSWAAESLGGVADITGAYIAGLMFAQTRFKHFFEGKFKTIAYGLFVPIFFVSIGLQANIWDLSGSLAFTALIVVGAIVTKVIGSGLGCWLSKFKPIEAIRVGTGMVSRGEVALIIANIGLARGVIDSGIFSIMVIMTLVTTLVTPILLRFLFPRQAEPAEAEAT
jgi:Kef-type K+ transport system membrane component KefB